MSARTPEGMAAEVGPSEEASASAGTPEAREPTITYRWWLRLQMLLMVAGGAATVVGMVLPEDFFTGAGLGLFVGALSLRLGRRACSDHPDARGRG